MRQSLVILAIVSAALAAPAQAQQPAAPFSLDQLPGAPAPATPDPVTHARNAGLGVCSDMLGKMSREVFRGPAAVQSGWNIKDPPNHVFQSVVGLRIAANKPPNALAALIAAPNPLRDCDGVAVQVYPLAVPCASVQQAMQKGGQEIANLEGVRVMLDERKSRLFLMPGAGATCVAVSIVSYFSGS